MTENDFKRLTSSLTAKPSPLRAWRLSVSFGALFLAFISMTLSLTQSASEQVSKLITEQNTTSLQLWGNLDYFKNHLGQGSGTDQSLPPGLFDATVEFSRRTATLVKTTHRLRLENVFSSDVDWTKMEKYIKSKDGRNVTFDHPGVNPYTNREDIIEQAMYQIELYQAVRDYAQNQSSYYNSIVGAITAFLLPICYAVLGACLFTLRQMLQQTIASDLGRSTRWIIALVLGTAISVFEPVISTGVSLPPLAIAFLIGYSSDVFVGAIDRVVIKFKDMIP